MTDFPTLRKALREDQTGRLADEIKVLLTFFSALSPCERERIERLYGHWWTQQSKILP